MEWIRAFRHQWPAALSLTALLLCSSTSIGSNLECPATVSNGQPACGVSRDAGSNAPSSTRSRHVGNPVDVVSGNKYQSEVDVRLGDSHLSLVRHYNSSSAGQNIGLGNGWRHTYSVMLSTDGDDVRQVVQADGRAITFRKNGDKYLAADATDGYISSTSDNRHIWFLPDGRRLSFFGSFLTSIGFPDGGSLSLLYRAMRLYTVTDELGRSLTFHYAPGVLGLPTYDPPDDFSAPGHLVSVDLPDESRVSYHYSGNQNLVSVDYPRGSQRNRGRRYEYQNPLNFALLTERADSLGNVIARWEYDQLGRAISYRSNGNIRGDGRDRGPPNLTLSYSAGIEEGDGETTVAYRSGTVHVYAWTVDSAGQVRKLALKATEPAATVKTESERQSLPPADTRVYRQHYPHDAMTIMAIDSMGYPSAVEHTLDRDGSTHSLKTVYDQAGRLVDVDWLSGVLEDFNPGQVTTIDELRVFIAQNRAARTNREIMYSAVSQSGFIEGTVHEFLETTTKHLSVGDSVTGEELDESLRTGKLDSSGLNIQPRNKVVGEAAGDALCIDPLRDCESLLRTQDYAEVAECAYVDSICTTRFVEVDLDVLQIGLGDLHDNSFHAEIYFDKELDVYIVSFAGTNLTSGGDWRSNLEQEFGFSSFQYERAVQLARRLVVNTPNANFTFVGHSLGGGLATAAAAAVGRQATVFNPAALDSESASGLSVEYENAQSNTQIYSVSGEILSDIQTEINFTNKPPGTMHVLPRPRFDWVKDNVGQNASILYGTRLGVALHGMDAVQQSLSELIDRYQCV